MIKNLILFILLIFFYFIFDKVKYYSDENKIIEINKIIKLNINKRLNK